MSDRAPWMEIATAAGQALAVVAGAVLLVMALPVLIPVLAVDGWIAGRRRRALAETSLCPVCGARLGGAALELSDEAWGREGVARARPGLRLRIVRMLDAICPACDARLRRDGQAFVPLAAEA